jgi:hypothetical protein
MQPEPPMQIEPPIQPDPPVQPEPPQNQPDPLVVDIFDNEKEYVGVDDEHMYIPIPPAQPSVSFVPSNDANENVAAEGAIPLEAEVTNPDSEEIRVLQDPDNPIIEKGALFPDIITFRKAIKHYAVKKGFEFAKRLKSARPYLLQGVSTLLVLGGFMLQGFMIRKPYRNILFHACSCLPCSD